MASTRPRTTFYMVCAAVALPVVAPTGARAAEASRVVSALDDANRFDFNLTLRWLRNAKTAAVKREFQSSLSPGKTELVKDLRFSQTRNVLDLRADVGVLWDVGLHVEVPLVLQDARSLAFDQTADSCVFPNDPSGIRPTCVNENNSSLLRDAVLPGFEAPMYGLDVEHARPFQRPSQAVFRGPDRSGVEYFAFGATWAVFNQLRDDTKPTWTVTFDARLSVGEDMRYDAAKPSASTGVGRGFHELHWATTVSRRFRYADPYFGAYYDLPLRTSGSPFERYARGPQSNVNPQQIAGLEFGLEHVVWESLPKQQRVTLEYRGRLEGRFEGRAHSEIWEPLSGSSRCRTEAAQCRKEIDQDLNNDGTADPFPGVTDIETHGTFGGDLGLNVQIGRYVRFRGLFGVTLEQPHFITFADAGEDKDRNGKVDTENPVEANPAYRETFDLPGRRFRVDETRIWNLFVEASLMF